MRIFSAGGLTFDTLIFLDKLPQPIPQTIFAKGSETLIGGTGAGKALALNRLFEQSMFHSMLGNDKSGKNIKSAFKKEKLKFIYDYDSAGTEEHVNLIASDGGRISFYTKYATFDPEFNANKLEHEIKKSDIVVLNIINYCRYLIPFAKKHGKKIWCDIHDYDGKNEYHADFIKNADYIFMSSDSMPDYIEFMRSMIKAGKELVIVTHGKSGASGMDRSGNIVNLPIIDSYKYVNSNGAGDNFFAGFLYGYTKTNDMKKAMQYGTICGGLCISDTGIINGNLSAELIEKEFSKHYSS